jgi:hypothetical protein
MARRMCVLSTGPGSKNTLFVGGSDRAGWVRNLSADGRVSVQLPDTAEVLIVEGHARQVVPDAHLAARLVIAVRKYEPMYGPASASSYEGNQAWAIVPHRALGWERFPSDATRWVYSTDRMVRSRSAPE